MKYAITQELYGITEQMTTHFLAPKELYQLEYKPYKLSRYLGQQRSKGHIFCFVLIMQVALTESRTLVYR